MIVLVNMKTRKGNAISRLFHPLQFVYVFIKFTDFITLCFVFKEVTSLGKEIVKTCSDLFTKHWEPKVYFV